MKKLTRALVLTLVLSMTLCLLPVSAAGKAKLPQYDYFFTADRKAEPVYGVQIGAWTFFDGAKTACELLRSYGYESYVFPNGGYFNVLVGVYESLEDNKDDIEAAVKDLKTLTRDSKYLTSCCSAYAVPVKLGEEAKKAFSAFGGEVPKATAEPKRTSIEMKFPYKTTPLKEAPTYYGKTPKARQFMYYEPNGEAGICGHIAHQEEVFLLFKDGEYSFVQNKQGCQGWVLNKYLSATKP